MKERFDHFCDRVEAVVAHPAFFAFCILIVVVWAPSILLGFKIDTWQLIINTTTTIITFLLVALLTNRQRDGEKTVEEIRDDVKRIADHLGL